MDNRGRIHIKIHGAVQGVGFRPFIFRLAKQMGLKGWVLNSTGGVFIETEGLKPSLEQFLLRIGKEKPPRSYIQSLEFAYLDPSGFDDFRILESSSSGEITAFVLPDIATCRECVSEVFDPSNRRYLYPFINCTNCGPRFSIIESLPYDRAGTTMRRFTMCRSCREEYHDPSDRRFHAQPNACHDCGPHAELWDRTGKIISSRGEAILQAADAILSGGIVAAKGLGGFHLLADARNEDAVKKLRMRKRREEKPLALMYPSLEIAKDDAQISALEERLLLSPESPIVLVARKAGSPGISSEVAPGNPYLGIMLPYTPLHHILTREISAPVVATSGNLSDEPICTHENEALERLSGIADLFLVHNRPIRRHADDSIVRIMMDRELVLRRARGYAPLPVSLNTAALAGRHEAGNSLLAVGAHLKNSVALTSGRDVFISQHIGDLESEEAFGAFQNVIQSLKTLYRAEPGSVICDMHPGYLSTQYAGRQDLPVIAVQHHHAHIASCMAENRLEGRLLGVAWDGTGYGLDGTVWGGEFLITGGAGFRRAASLRQFRLPGGEQAVREPRRAAIGLLYEIFGYKLFSGNAFLPLQDCTPEEQRVFSAMLEKGVNSPLTSSVGRLFDAVSSIIGLRHRTSFEGQAAMELEFQACSVSTDESYRYGIKAGEITILDWEPVICGILDDLSKNVPRAQTAAKFHNTLTEMILDVARRCCLERIVLSGGCFQNRYLTERAVEKLRGAGFRPYWHQRVPPNDGGIALGQIAAVLLSESKPVDRPM